MNDYKWDVDHMRRPEDDECPVCGETFDRANEFYPTPQFSYVGEYESAAYKVCATAGVASASPDPTLIVFYHEEEP